MKTVFIGGPKGGECDDVPDNLYTIKALDNANQKPMDFSPGPLMKNEKIQVATYSIRNLCGVRVAVVNNILSDEQVSHQIISRLAAFTSIIHHIKYLNADPFRSDEMLALFRSLVEKYDSQQQFPENLLSPERIYYYPIVADAVKYLAAFPTHRTEKFLGYKVP